MKIQALVLFAALIATLSAAQADVNFICDDERNDSRGYISVSEGTKTQAFLYLGDAGTVKVPRKTVQPMLDSDIGEMDGVEIEAGGKTIAFKVMGKFNKIRGMSLDITVVEDGEVVLELTSCLVRKENPATF